MAVTVAAASCAGPPTSANAPAASRGFSPATGSQYISHVVVMIQENRSFDNLFATFPGAAGATQGKMKTPSGYTYVPLQKTSLNYPCDFGHSYNGVIKDYDGGAMDGFGLEGGGKKCPGQQGTAPYQYVDPLEIVPYWQIAETYVLGDHMFQTQGSGSFSAHQDLIAGGSTIDPQQTKTVIDFPSKKPWGCDAPNGTVTSVIIAKGSSLQYRYHHGPFPCFKYQTLRDLLDTAGLSWRYYTPPEPGGIGALWNGFDAIDAVRNGPEWNTNIVSQTQIFSDITGGALPAVSWVIPTEANSDHPGNASDTGPSWVGSVVNAIGESQYWNSTAIVVVWDDWGGFYDHVPPPFFDRWGGLGFRVPLLIASPYARQGSSRYGGYVSHTQYEFGSILKFIEDVFGLGRLGTTDVRANSIDDSFDFTQAPRAFVPIGTKYSRSFFERQPPSRAPVDTE